MPLPHIEPAWFSMPVILRTKDAIYLRIDEALQRPCDGCDCPYCKAHPNETPSWDTLAIPLKISPTDFSWTVHMPDPLEVRRYLDAKQGEILRSVGDNLRLR